jgi:hypothetical protein
MPLTKATQNVIEGIVSTGSTGIFAGSFIVGQQYKITSLGTTTQPQWNTIAGTTGQTYVVESLFTAATTGASSGNGAAAVARTLANRFADVVNVLDFGAFNNNSSANAALTTTAIQNAINTGKNVYFPEGTYYCTPDSVLKTFVDGQMIFGAGQKLTKIVHACIKIKNSYCDVKDFHMYGASSGGTNQYGIWIDDDRTNAQRKLAYSTRVGTKVFGVVISNKMNAIAITDTGAFDSITNCYFSGNKNGIWLANDFMVPDADLISSSWDRGDTIISDNIIVNNRNIGTEQNTGVGGVGIYCQNHGTYLISNNKIIGNGVNILAKPNWTATRDERVSQIFMSNNSLENAYDDRIFSIVSIANNGSGNARVTVNGNHLLPETHEYRVDISGTTNYNGEALATWVSATQFDINKSFVSDQTGTINILGWDFYVPSNTFDGCVFYCNINGGDINQFNIEIGANYKLNNLNVKYQRRFGSDFSGVESANINGVNRMTVGYAAINLYASGNYNITKLATNYVLLNSKTQFNNGIEIADVSVNATSPNQQPASPNENGNIFSGTYTPTGTGVTNVATISTTGCQYARIGNYVMVSGSITVDATSAGLTEWRMSLPVASGLTSSNNLGGTFSTFSAGDQDTDNGCIIADATNDQALFRATLTQTGSTAYSFSFGYIVK